MNDHPAAADAPLFRGPWAVIYDLEWTSWEGFLESGWSMPGKHREIVQIGAVGLDVEDGFRETGHFQVLARATRNPELSQYFTALTGLTQDAVDSTGLPVIEALEKFADFVGDSADIASWGNDLDVITETCTLNGIAVPPALVSAFDVTPSMMRRLGLSGRIASGELTGVLGLPAVGRRHDALSDARGIAAALRLLRARGRA